MNDSIVIGARDCELVDIDKLEVDDFLTKYHLQGTCEGQRVCKGLVYRNNLVALMTFGYPRYNDNTQWELLRLCFNPEYRISGGSQRLFNAFLVDKRPENVISYCNLDLFSGHVYEELQFKKLSAPSESFKWVKGAEWISDAQLRKYGADKLIGTSDGKGTDNAEIMLREGWKKEHYQTVQTYLWDSQIDGIIYKITNKLNNKCYIGQSKYSDDSRWRAHCAAHAQIIDKAIDKYGKENFTYEVIDRATSFYELNLKERQWIAKISPEYNDRKGGRYSFIDSRPEEVKLKISASMKKIRAEFPDKYVCSEETKEKIRKANLGKKQSQETIQKRSASMKGKKPQPPAEKTRAKMRESAKNRPPVSAETRKKLSDVQKRLNHRPEDLLKAREAAIQAIRGKKVVYDLTGRKKLVLPEEVDYYLAQGYTRHITRKKI